MSEKLIQFLEDEFSRMDVDYQARKKARVKWHRIFRGLLDPRQEKNLNKSRLVINQTKVAVMHGVANVIDIIFANADFFDVAGRTPYDQEGAAIIKKLVTWLLERSDFLEEATRYVLQAAIFGTSFAKIVKKSYVDVSVDHTPVLNFMRRVVGLKKHYITQTITYPVIETIDNDDIWIDPTALSIESASGLFHRFRRTAAYMKSRGYDNTADLLKADTQKGETDERRKSVGLPEVEPPEGELEFYEYHGKVPLEAAREAGLKPQDNESEVESIVTWHKDKKVLLRVERNTFPGQERMFIRDIWELSGDKDLYGRGIPENVRGPQMALNATVNLRLDNKAWAIAHPIAVDMNGLEDETDLEARVNWIIRCNRDPKSVIHALEIPDITAGSMQEEHDFERIINNESGISGTVQASQSFGSNRTAEGISIAFSAASRPIRLVARGFERNLISKGLKKLYTMFLMDMNEEILIRVTDNPQAPEFVRVDPMSLSLDIDFVPKGTFALASREAVAQNITQFAAAISNVPQVLGNINWAFLTKKFYESLFGATDWDQVWIGGGGNANQPGAGVPIGQAGATQEAAQPVSVGVPGGAGAVPGTAGGTGQGAFG